MEVVKHPYNYIFKYIYTSQISKLKEDNSELTKILSRKRENKVKKTPYSSMKEQKSEKITPTLQITGY